MGSEQSAQSRGRSTTAGDARTKRSNQADDTACRANQQQRTRSASVDSTVTADYIQSGLSKPIAAAGSDDHLQAQQSAVTAKRAIPKEIIIVSRGDEGDEQRFTFPPPFKPLIPIGHESLLPGVPQLNPQFVSAIGLALEEQLKSRADFVQGQQGVLVELIRELDFVTSFLTNNILTDRQKRVTKVADNFAKFTEINKLVDKIEADLDVCLVRLTTLNNALPVSHRLELFTGHLVRTVTYPL